MRAPVLPTLSPGDRVAVIAPSSPLRPEMLEEGLEQVRGLGLEPVAAADVVDRHRFTAGTDARRLREIHEALADASVRALWMARGGHGVTPILRDLDLDLVARAAKPLVGESDATALGMAWLSAGLGWLHGPMVAGSLRLGDAGFEPGSLRAALFAQEGTLSPPGVRCLREGRADGPLWGGCLTLLAALAGTPWLRPPPSGVLVLEDVGVKPYQVHRMLVQLRDARALAGVVGVVLGDFSDCVQHPDQGYDVADVIAELLLDTLGDVPITIGWPIGHASAPHVTLPMGPRARLEARGGGASLAWRRAD